MAWQGNEWVEVRVKVEAPGEPGTYLRLYGGKSVDRVPFEEATVFDSLDQAFSLLDHLEDTLGHHWPEATFKVQEEGWTGNWPGTTAAHAAFWRQ